MSDRQELIRQVTTKGVQTAIAAKNLDINYEAAKHIIQDYRRTGHVEPLRLRKRKQKYACLAWISKELANKRIVDDPDADKKLAELDEGSAAPEYSSDQTEEITENKSEKPSLCSGFCQCAPEDDPPTIPRMPEQPPVIPPL